MRGLDTNVLLRPLLDDDPGQVAVVQALLRDLEARGERAYVNGIVLCEACWVLRSNDFSRDEIVAVLERILETGLFVIQDRDLARRALAEYRLGKADFADYLIGSQNREVGCEDTVTFDRKLEGAAGFSVLSP